MLPKLVSHTLLSLIAFTMPTITRATLSLSEQLTYSTVRIESQFSNGSTMTGSGFFYDFLKDQNGVSVPAIVTNKHVIRGAIKGSVTLNKADAAGNCEVGVYETVQIEDGEKQWIQHPDPEVDLAILPIGAFLNQQLVLGKKFFYVSLDDSLIPTKDDLESFTAIEEVVMVGYPNGIWDMANNRPIVRRGITATAPTLNYNGKREFMIDAACFPGSSGSPVFLLNQGSYSPKSGGIVLGTRIKLLGILYAGPQHIAVGEMKIVPIGNPTRTVSVASIPNNLGVVIKADRLRDFDQILRTLKGK